MVQGVEKSSFRDRDGFVYYNHGKVYRVINHSYKPTWDQLNATNFLADLVREGKMPAFQEASPGIFFPGENQAYKVLEAEKIPFISYPAEWSFEQLKRAALLTLAIQKKALLSQFSLKDASAYNVQFVGAKAVFIDLLSFDIYSNNEPWAAYGQFCRHFLGPLLLQAYNIEGLEPLANAYIDGLPLNLVSRLLPFRSKFSALAYTHIHLHARFENKHAGDKEVKRASLKISKARSLSIIEHLESGIKALSLKRRATNWTGYYDSCSYTQKGYESKKAFVEKHLLQNSGALCVDLGANTGEFSEMAAKHFTYVVASDSDREVVRAIQRKKMPNVLPLCVNLVNPSPSYGWNGEERNSFLERAKKSDMVLALALIHHLCIGNNIPLPQLAAFFSGFAGKLVIEFVPRSDEQVRKLLVTKKDVFQAYTLDGFISAFSEHYVIEDRQQVEDSERVVMMLKRR